MACSRYDARRVTQDETHVEWLEENLNVQASVLPVHTSFGSGSEAVVVRSGGSLRGDLEGLDSPSTCWGFFCIGRFVDDVVDVESINRVHSG